MKKYIFLFTLIFFSLQISAQAVIDRTKAPIPGTARTPEIASYESFTLKNGLKVFVVENHKLPRITMRLILDRDPIIEGNKAGYVQIAGDLIGSGTKSKTKAEIDEAIDFMGASFSTSSSSITANGLSKYTDKLLSIFSDVLLNPRFSESEFTKIKAQMISGIKSSEDNADAISQKLTQASIYGLKHPYGEVLTEATVNSIKLEDCISYWETYFRPNIGYMIIIGDITLEDAKKKTSKAFKKWKKKIVPEANYNKTSLPNSSRVLLVNKPSAVQSLIWIGNVINLTPGHPDIEPLRIANKILGGGMSGRLFINIREDKGYTYGAYSNFGIDRLNSTFSASAKVRNEVTDSAIVEFLNEYEKITTEPVTEEDLKAAKSSLSGSFGRSLESPSSAASFALNIARYNLDSDYYNDYLNRIQNVTVEDVLRVAKKYISTDKTTIAVVGKAQDISSKLTAFGNIEYYDAFAQPTEEPEFLFIPENITLKDVLSSYYKALGGLEKLKKLRAISQESSIEIPGAPQKLSILRAKMTPDKVLEKQTMGSMTISKTLYDNGKAEKSGMRGSGPVEGLELQELKNQAKYVVGKVGWMDRLENFSFDGQTLISGKEVYQISETVSGIGGDVKSKKIHYFDVASGLLYQSIENQESPQGNISITTTIREWEEINGIKFEKIIETTAGPQKFKITLDSTLLDGDVKESIFK